jgi:hypothetical protein
MAILALPPCAMRKPLPSLRLSAALWSLAALAPVMALEPEPDFRLQDVNPHSPRFGALVSPRDYRQQVSAYYFGHEN